MLKKRILFVTYGGGHVNMILPIIRELASYPKIDIQVLGLTTASHTLAHANIPQFGFKKLIKPADERALKKGVILAKDIDHNSNVDYEETVAYLGLSYVDLEHRYSPEIAN